MKHKTIYILILACSFTFGQKHAWPTSTGKQLTSNFGEFRGDHFHMGIDIRTNQSTGHPLYAVSDGYIYRIATNFAGYGKALYLMTTDNKIALYGHLAKYPIALESKLDELQNKDKSYFVNQYFTKDEYPVKRGDIIGYSGNSGGSTGPHLHFEFRNASDQPLNPLVYGFPVADSAPPLFLDLAIIPMNAGARIGSTALPKTFQPKKTSNDGFFISDTISVQGDIGLAVKIADKIPYVPYSYQPHYIELSVDSIPLFSVNYDSLDFREDNYVRTVLGQPPVQKNSVDFQKLYLLKNYPKLLVHKGNQSGILNLSPGFHNITIKTVDAAQNESVLSFTVDAIKDTVQFIELHPDALYDLTSIPLNKDNFVPEFLVLENGAIFKVEVDSNQYNNIYAFIERSDSLHILPLDNDQNNYVSDLIGFDKFGNHNRIGLLFASDSISKYYYTSQPQLLFPDSNQTIFSKDSLITVSLFNSFFDTTLTWITDVSSRFYSARQNRVSRVYDIFPKGIPANENLQVTFNFDNNLNTDRFAVYRFDEEKRKWKYVKSKIDTTIVSAGLSSPQIIAVFEDTQLPWVENSFPEANQVYAQDLFNEIKIRVDDNLSGIDYSENNLQVYLNGERLWVAYQPFEQEISYELKKPLALGEHKLDINFQDRSGNSIAKSFKFFIE